MWQLNFITILMVWICFLNENNFVLIPYGNQNSKSKTFIEYNNNWVHSQLGTQKECIVPKSLKTLYWITITFMKYFFGRFFFSLVLTYFLIKMVVIFCDFNDLNMSLSVLKDGLGTVSHYVILSKNTQQD